MSHGLWVLTDLKHFPIKLEEKAVQRVHQVNTSRQVVLLEVLEHVVKDVGVGVVLHAVRAQEHPVEVLLGCLQELLEELCTNRKTEKTFRKHGEYLLHPPRLMCARCSDRLVDRKNKQKHRTIITE